MITLKKTRITQKKTKKQHTKHNFTPNEKKGIFIYVFVFFYFFCDWQNDKQMK